MNLASELSEFFKHCANVGGNMRYISDKVQEGPKWCGWMRCRISPYLNNSKLDYHKTKPNMMLDENTDITDLFYEKDGWVFKNCLIYTLTDYSEYIAGLNSGSDEAIKRTHNLINEIQKYTSDDLINIIESNSTLFPSIDDSYTDSVLNEHWNEHII